METLRLHVYPEPVLRKKNLPVTDFGGRLQDLVADMVRIMQDHDGVGLAAPQAGVSLRLAVILAAGVLHVLTNPRVIASTGIQEGEEGCLSFPGIYGNVSRPMKVTIRHQGMDGTERDEEVEGFLARAFLHEMDHLDGKLLIDHFSPLKRSMAKKKMQKNGRENGRTEREERL